VKLPKKYKILFLKNNCLRYIKAKTASIIAEIALRTIIRLRNKLISESKIISNINTNKHKIRKKVNNEYK
jgi:hypothetical protein